MWNLPELEADCGAQSENGARPRWAMTLEAQFSDGVTKRSRLFVETHEPARMEFFDKNSGENPWMKFPTGKPCVQDADDV